MADAEPMTCEKCGATIRDGKCPWPDCSGLLPLPPTLNSQDDQRSRMTETTTVAHAFAVAEAMRMELDKHHTWDDPNAKGPIKGCGHTKLAPYDFEKMAEAVLRTPGVVLMSEWTLRKVWDELAHNCPALLEGELCRTCVTRQEVSASLAAYIVAHGDRRANG